jgi:hypothetical protein
LGILNKIPNPKIIFDKFNIACYIVGGGNYEELA